MDCSFDFLYYLTRPGGSNINFHKHKCYELVYYMAGSGKTNIGGKPYSYEQNSFAIIEPNSLHDEERTKETEVLFIGFQCIECPIVLKNGIYKDYPSHDILKILLLLKTELLGKNPYYKIKLKSLLMDLFVSLGRLSSSSENQELDLSHIERFISENYTFDINYQTLAELSDYSYDRFRHIFKEVYGLSPHQYLIQVRLKSAHRMLLETSYSITRISEENCFASQSQFCSLFKKAYGCTPGKLRRL
ncbi:MAG TPA: AraC family transcriptional regulator [Clostridiaceae bacterium]